MKKAGKIERKKLLLEMIQEKITQQSGNTPSLNEVIIMVCEDYLRELRLTDQHIKKIQKAADSAKITPSQVLSKACDWAERFYQNRYQERPTDPSLPGSAYYRIDQFVKKLMKKNDQCRKKEDKVYINQTYLATHQGSNREAIKGYLELNKEVLSKHHKKHGLSSRHNIDVNSYFKHRK